LSIALWWQNESWGGVDTHAVSLINAWPAADEFVIFHNERNPGVTRVRAMLPAGIVKTVAVPEWHSDDASRLMRAGHSVLLPLRFWRWSVRARQVLAAHGPFDALIASNGGYPGAWTALAALWGASRLGIARRMLLVHHAASAFGIGRQTFERLLDRAVQRWATDLVTVSRATRETLIRIRHFDTERNPIRVIHNGIAATSAPAAASDLRGRWQVAPGEFLVGMIGRIERYKGHEDVLLALAELPDALRGRIRLVIVGTGHAAELERLRALSERLRVADRVVFAGFVDTESRAIVQQFDLLVMATKDFEGFGLSIAEAMSVGTPVLATKVGGVTEFANDNVAMLVPPEAPEEIARALETAVRDPAAGKQRASRALEHIKMFSETAMSQRFHRLLSL